jgi:hypothetical protein
MKTMKTGGMSNPNKKTATSKRATGKVGGVSKAPKTAIPKAQMGGNPISVMRDTMEGPKAGGAILPKKKAKSSRKTKKEVMNFITKGSTSKMQSGGSKQDAVNKKAASVAKATRAAKTPKKYYNPGSMTDMIMGKPTVTKTKPVSYAKRGGYVKK